MCPWKISLTLVSCSLWCCPLNQDVQNSCTEQIGDFRVELGPDWLLGLRLAVSEEEKKTLGYVLCKVG